MSLTNKTLKDTYVDLLQLDNSNSGTPTTLKNVKDGAGVSTALMISDDQVRILPTNDNTSSSLQVRAKSGGIVLSVDTTNELVSASGNIVNTQYAYFSVVTTHFSSAAANNHYAIPFVNGNNSSTLSYIDLGTGTDPVTSFTTSTDAFKLVPTMWYIPDNMTIDAVYSLEGADAATGDTTRMHLMSYDFTSGATSCLTNGTLLAHNSDVTNAGYEQPYLSTWTVDSSDVVAGKVVLAAFRSDSNNSDYSLTIKVKYHLT
tara:strand:+ start:1082 stop:1858 length:777 start_codon:yes stop_codon:yes gene_type:complete